MSTPSPDRRKTLPSSVPIAYPPRSQTPRPTAPATASPRTARDSPLAEDLWNWAAFKSWGGSVGLHTILLLILGFWYFTPPDRRPLEFDSRIGGSTDGILGGTTLLGGLLTPEDEAGAMTAIPTPSPEPLLEMAPLDAGLLAMPGRGARASVGGGAPNTNPGAGSGDGFGIARFGDGSETIRGIQVKVGDPQFTLIWDAPVDLDLHVIEPGGKEIYWEERKGEQGGELDVDNVTGYGPENIYWLVEAAPKAGSSPATRVKGDGPPGVYRWFVSYYGGFGGIARPTQWQVRIKHRGRVTIQRGRLRSFDQNSPTYTLTVGPKGSSPADEEDDKPLLPPERP